MATLFQKKAAKKKKPRNMDWKKLIDEIVSMDPNSKWTYTKIGDVIGTSRSTIGRLMAEPDRGNHIDEPKWSQGMSIIELHAEIRDKREKHEL